MNLLQKEENLEKALNENKKWEEKYIKLNNDLNEEITEITEEFFKEKKNDIVKFNKLI